MRVGGMLYDDDPPHGRCSRTIVYASSYAARQKSDSNQLLLKLDKEKLNYQTGKSRCLSLLPDAFEILRLRKDAARTTKVDN